MAEDRGATRQRIENLNLCGCIGDVILAANDVRDAEVDVVELELADRLGAGSVDGGQCQDEPVQGLGGRLDGLVVFLRLGRVSGPQLCLADPEHGLVAQGGVLFGQGL